MDNPFFSIVSVTLNNKHGLQKTDHSLKIQSFRDFEWIVVDGGSHDGTLDDLKTSTAHWSSEPDGGIYDAMNKGLAKSTGQYVIFLNAGDRLAFANTLLRLHNLIQAEKKPPDFVYGDSREADSYKPARDPDHLSFGMFTHHQAMIYRREALGSLNYDIRYKIAADYDFTARLLQQRAKILYFPLPVCLFEPGGISQTNARLGRKEQFLVRHRLNLCGPLKNIIIYLLQGAWWTLRTRMPTLYWRVKSSGNRRPGFAQI